MEKKIFQENKKYLKNPESSLGKMDFEAKQNAVGFFSLLLEVAKRNPELWKQIYNENNENNRDTNNPD